MKYIRTKTGVYEQYKCILNGWNFVFETKIKEADTIEELCDEFVIYGNDKRCHILDRITKIDKYAVCKDNSAMPVKELIEIGCSIYGAIWTDKGLIYVAKMNKEGVLELI